MTINFDKAFDYMIQYEGNEFVDNPADKGGATKFGISEKFIESLKDYDVLPSPNVTFFIKKDDTDIVFYIKNLIVEQAKWIYQKYFWLPIYDYIENPDICNYIFDMTVQHGKQKAAELVQRAINLYRFSPIRVNIDGIIGSNTLSEINDCDFIRFIPFMVAVRESFFLCIISHDPSQQQFLSGWIKRAYGG